MVQTGCQPRDVGPRRARWITPWSLLMSLLLGLASSPLAMGQWTPIGSQATANSSQVGTPDDPLVSVTLGVPEAVPADAAPSSNAGATVLINFDASNDFGSGPLDRTERLARQIADDPLLPPPASDVNAALPPPAAQPPGTGTAQAGPKPFDVNYVFLGRAGIDDPSTNVKMSEIGARYRHAWMLGSQARLVVRPMVDVLFLSGPGGPTLDLPEQLYKVAVDFQGDYKFNDRLGLTIGITPGLWTDFLRVTSDDVRIPARILATYRYSDQLYLAGGLVYTDNIRRNLLPGFGVIWMPNEKTSLELIYPRFRAMYMWHEEVKFYTGFERGGTTYNIRTDGFDQDFEYRDWRWFIGTEIDLIERMSFIVETGLAFDRKFRFDVWPEEDINRAFYFRIGTRF